MLSALDVFPSLKPLPTAHRDPKRTWRLGQVLPMSGRIIFERLVCSPTYSPAHIRLKIQHHHNQMALHQQQQIKNSTYIRININDGMVPLPNCNSGPGSSCPLDEFLAFVKKRGDEIEDFREICGLGDDAPSRVEFLHQ